MARAAAVHIAAYGPLLDAAPDAMIIVDRRGRIVRANGQADRLFGYVREELLGQPVELLVPARFHARHAQHRERFFEAPRVRPMGAGLDLFGRRKDGTEFPVEISLSPLAAAAGPLVIAAIRDISEHKRVEDALRASLREKDVLLREVHHRVKNNLQVISSLLGMQAYHARDAHAEALLEDSRSRVQSIALVHEMLYRSNEVAHVSAAAYVQQLAAELFRAYSVDPARVSLHVDAGGTLLDIDAALHCGLLLHELLSNCLKHAFPGGRSGRIDVVVSRVEEGRVRVVVRDDGVGLPPGFDLRSVRTLGLRLVEMTARQLSGTVDVRSDGGTELALTLSTGARKGE